MVGSVTYLHLVKSIMHDDFLSEDGANVNDIWEWKKFSYIVGYTTYTEVPEK